jgi:hypothetical protein
MRGAHNGDVVPLIGRCGAACVAGHVDAFANDTRASRKVLARLSGAVEVAPDIRARDSPKVGSLRQVQARRKRTSPPRSACAHVWSGRLLGIAANSGCRSTRTPALACGSVSGHRKASPRPDVRTVRRQQTWWRFGSRTPGFTRDSIIRRAWGLHRQRGDAGNRRPRAALEPTRRSCSTASVRSRIHDPPLRVPSRSGRFFRRSLDCERSRAATLRREPLNRAGFAGGSTA